MPAYINSIMMPILNFGVHTYHPNLKVRTSKISGSYSSRPNISAIIKPIQRESSFLRKNFAPAEPRNSGQGGDDDNQHSLGTFVNQDPRQMIQSGIQLQDAVPPALVVTRAGS